MESEKVQPSTSGEPTCNLSNKQKSQDTKQTLKTKQSGTGDSQGELGLRKPDKKSHFSKISKIVSKFLPKSSDLKNKFEKSKHEKTNHKDKLKRQLSSSTDQPEKKRQKSEIYIKDKAEVVINDKEKYSKNKNIKRDACKTNRQSLLSTSKKPTKKSNTETVNTKEQKMQIQKDIEEIFGPDSPKNETDDENRIGKDIELTFGKETPILPRNIKTQQSALPSNRQVGDSCELSQGICDKDDSENSEKMKSKTIMKTESRTKRKDPKDQSSTKLREKVVTEKQTQALTESKHSEDRQNDDSKKRKKIVSSKATKLTETIQSTVQSQGESCKSAKNVDNESHVKIKCDALENIATTKTITALQVQPEFDEEKEVEMLTSKLDQDKSANEKVLYQNSADAESETSTRQISSETINMKLEDSLSSDSRPSSSNSKKGFCASRSSKDSKKISRTKLPSKKSTKDRVFSVVSEDSSSNETSHLSVKSNVSRKKSNAEHTFTPILTQSSNSNSRSSSRQSNRSRSSSRQEQASKPLQDSDSGSRSRIDSKSSSKQSSRSGSKHSSCAGSMQTSRQSSRSSSPSEGSLGMEQLRLLSEQLNSLNRDSCNLTTQMYKKQTPKKKVSVSRKASTTPRKTPLKSPRRQGIPQTTPGRRNVSLLSLPSSASPKVYKSPSKEKPKRRLYEKSPILKGKKRKFSSGEENKPKRPLKVKFQFKPTEHGEASNSSCDNSDDVDSDALEIASDIEDFDVLLSNKSKKLKLTARNVKSIIHQVIKNEHVSDLFRKSIVDEHLEDQLKEAIFDPKMTRAKVKEVMEKGNFPPPWTLSPIKGLKPSSTESKPSILDINFPDNDEDQEYRPTLEELEQTDDDEASILSSQASDFGSPLLPSPAPNTPSARFLLCESSSTPRALFQEQSDVEEELIASRTRSKLPLKNTTIDAIESNFVAPDITPDMYDTNCNDEDWTDFLSSLTKDEKQLNDTYDDEQNDPEFNFLEEQEQEELDTEDFRDDKAVRISKKELNELMDELFEAYGGADLLDDDENTRDSLNQSEQCLDIQTSNSPTGEKKGDVEEGTLRPPVQKNQDASTSSMPPPLPRQKYPGHLPPLKLDPHLASILVSDIIKIQGKSDGDAESSSSERSSSPDNCQSTIIEDEIIQIQDQMRKHVQLLAQTYIQAGDHPKNQKVSQLASSYLLELQHLGNKSIQSGCPQSFFHATNLSGALELCQTKLDNTEDLKKMVKEVIVYHRVMSGANYDIFGLTYDQMDVFMNNSVFMFPQMIPENRFPVINVPEKKRVTFTEAEDNLLVIGLDQFGSMPNKYSYVQKFLLPTKTVEQLRIRCKNLKGRAKEESVLQQYQKTNKLPEFERYLQLEDIEDVVPPRERDVELLPRWTSSYYNVRVKLGIDTENQFIPIEPSTDSNPNSRCNTPFTAVLKAKIVSKDEPTDQTLGLSGLQHFKTVDSNEASKVSSRCSTPGIEHEPNEEPSPMEPCVKVINANIQPDINKAIEIIQQQSDSGIDYKTTKMRTRSQSGSSTDTALSTPLAQISPAVTQVELKDIEVSKDLAVDLRSTFASDNPLNSTAMSGFSKYLSVSSSSSLQHEFDSFSTPPKSKYSTAFNKQSIQSTAPSTPQLMHILTTTVSSPVTWTPDKLGVIETDIGSPSLIGAAMAEAIGMSVDELRTPEGIKKIGVTPSKVPGIVPLAEKRPDVKKSLASIYETSVLNQSPVILQKPSTDTEPVKDRATEEKNTNIIMKILHENEKNIAESTSELSTTTKEHEQHYHQSIPVTPTNNLFKQNQSIPVTPTDPFKASEAFKISPVSLNLIAETSTMFPDKLFSKPQIFDTNSVLVTPKKIVFDDEQENSSSRVSFPAVSPSTLFGTPGKNSLCGFASNDPDTPSKTAVKIMAEMAQEILSPNDSQSESKRKFVIETPSPRKTPQTPRVSTRKESKETNATPSRKSGVTPCQGRKELNFFGKISPKKTTPTKCVTILPAGPIPPSPVKSPILPKAKTTPRRQILQQKARAIAPKGLVINTYLSPVKQVAAAITAKAKHYLSPQKKTGRLRPILPKAPVGDVNRRIFSPTPNDNDGSKEVDEYNTEGSEYLSDKELEEEDFVMTRHQRQLLKKQRLQQLKDEDKENDTPSDPGQDSQDELDEDDEEHLAQLMAASTTIRFDPRQPDSTQMRSKGQIKKDTILEMLAPDLLQTDPLRDERDTVFAQSYLNKVRDSLADEQDKYTEFLRLLFEFGKSKSSPVQLYQDMYHLFAGHSDLLEDFSSFLLPDQAKECGCLMAHLEFQKARTFLRKLELHFKRLPGMLQRVLKAFAKWEKLPTKNIKDLQAEIRPLLKGQQYLLDEFSTFFEDERVPDSYMTDFEEVTIVSGDEDNTDLFDGYEEVELPGGDDSLYGTKLCICKCHIETTCAEYKEKKKHCISCGIKVIRGRLYLQSDKKLRPLHIKFSQPVKMPAHLENENLSEEEAEEEADEEELSLSEVEEGDMEGDKVIEQEALEEDEDDVDDKVIEPEEIEEDEEEIDDKATEEVIDEEDMDEKVLEQEDEEEMEEEEEEEEEEDNNESETDRNDDNNESETEQNNEDHDGEEGNESEYVEEEDAEVQTDDIDEEDEGHPSEDMTNKPDVGLVNGNVKVSENESANEDDDDVNDSEEEQLEDDTEVEEAGSDPDVIEEGDGEDVEDVDPDENEIQHGLSEKENSGESSENKECQSDPESRFFNPLVQSKTEDNAASPIIGPTDFSSLREEIQLDRQQSGSISDPAFSLSAFERSVKFSNVEDNKFDSNNTDLLNSDSGTVKTRNSTKSSDSLETYESIKSDSIEVKTTNLVEKPIMVEENASFNLVSNTPEEIEMVMKPSALTCEELIGSVSDTEDTTNFHVSLRNSSQNQNSSQQQNSSTLDTSSQEQCINATDVSSQEQCSNSNENDNGLSQNDDNVTWTMEQDKLVLEMVKTEGASFSTFEKIAHLLTDKTAEQVETRFGTILTLLSDENDSDEDPTDEEDT